jgi:hypothetical protein
MLEVLAGVSVTGAAGATKPSRKGVSSAKRGAPPGFDGEVFGQQLSRRAAKAAAAVVGAAEPRPLPPAVSGWLRPVGQRRLQNGGLQMGVEAAERGGEELPQGGIMFGSFAVVEEEGGGGIGRTLSMDFPATGGQGPSNGLARSAGGGGGGASSSSSSISNLAAVDAAAHAEQQEQEGSSSSSRVRAKPCVLCGAGRACMLLLPCKHIDLCETCANNLPVKGGMCPVCKASVVQKVQVRKI